MREFLDGVYVAVQIMIAVMVFEAWWEARKARKVVTEVKREVAAIKKENGLQQHNSPPGSLNN